MRCPKCRSCFESVHTRSGVVDRCTHCKGLWFDMLEHEDLKDVARDVDTGRASLGAVWNTVDRINCPLCPNTPLLRMVDPQQPHIWFESCPHCFGRFYDAGEFRDFAELTLGDVFKRLFAKART